MTSKIIRADGTTELASIKSVTYHESVNADIDLRPGCVASSYIEVTCFGQQSDAPDVGEELTYYQVVGEEETLIGIFYAEPSIPTKNSYSFVAYDAVHKLDADFSSWLSANQENFPYTVYQLVSQACTIAGVTLGTSSWTFNTMSVNAFYADGITCRNIIQYAAEIACKFVRCNTSGEIIFDWYKAAVGDTQTASVAIATFDDAVSAPLKSLTAQIVPVQPGSGDPSPDNVRPISGWTGVNGQRTGVNVWDEEWEVGGINWTTGGNSGETDRIRSKGFIPVKPNTQYNFTPEFVKYVWFFDYAKNVIPKVSGNNNFKQFSPTAHELTIPNNCYFIRFLMWTTYGTTYNHDISINYPSTDTSYHAYTGETLSVNWQSTAGTVYGGNLTVNEDGSGVLTVDKANIASYAGEALTGEWISDRDVYAQGTNPTVGAQVVYALATTLTYNLTEEQLTTLLGTNNIWVDTGDVSVTYYTPSGKIYPTSGTHDGMECFAYKQDGLNYDNYDTSALARVAVHPVGEEEVAYYYPTGVTSGNTLDITNNALLYGASAADMSDIAQTVYDGITAVGQYRPMGVSMFPNECPFRSGQIVPVTDAQGVSFTTAIMSKVVTDSAVTLTSTGREVYGDYALDTAKKLIQLAADIVQINKLKVDWAEIDQIFARDITVTGKLHSDDYRYTTGSIYASAGMGIDFSAKRMNTPNFALTPSGDIHARGGQIAGFNISRSISVAYYAAAPSFFDVDGAASANYTWESATHKMTLGEDGTVRYQPANKSYLVDGQVVNLSSVWVRCVYGGRINDSWYTPFVVISYLDASDNVIYQEDWSNINYQAPDGTSGSRILVNQTYLAAASKVRFDLRLLEGDYCSGCEYDYGVTSSLNYNADRLGSANGIYLGTDGISVGDGNVLTPDGSGRIGQLTTKKNIVQADKAEYVTIEEGLYGQVGKNVPSSVQNKCGDVVYDADNYMIWYSRISRLSNDLLYRSFVIQRLLSDGVTKAQNGFYLRLDDSGNPSVAFTANAATAWLKALGIDWNTGFSGIYTDYTQLGFTSVPTMSALASALPTQSIAMMTNTMVDQSEMTLPDGSNAPASVVVIFKQTNVRAFAIGGRAYANVPLLNAGLYYAAWNSSEWVGWKKLVTENNNGYLAGETLSFTSALYNVMWTGLAPNTTIVRFEIPLSRPVLATTASVSGSVRIRGEGINSLVSLADANVATAVTINPCGIGVQLTFSSAHGFSGNTVVTVHPETSFSITFS